MQKLDPQQKKWGAGPGWYTILEALELPAI